MSWMGRMAVLAASTIAAGVALAEPVGEDGASAAGSIAGGDVVLLLVYILLALIFSFLCSIAEAVLLSITPSYIAGLRENHPKRAKALKRLKQDNIDRSLAAILTLNTIAHTVGAIGAGAKATVVFGSAWFGLFSAVMTLLILFLSEIIPKTLGAVHWRSLAAPTAVFVAVLIAALYPLIWASERLTRLVSGGQNVHVFSREEFLAMTGVGERAGEIEKQESWIIRNLFRLSSLTARDVMTPRTVIEALQEDLTVDEALPVQGGFSRLPVYRADIDDVTGFVLKDDILHALAEQRRDVRLRDLRRDLRAVPDSTPLSKLLEDLLDSRRHISLVLNEYGGTVGLVTLEDVVETLVGREIVDEMDTVEDMQEMARRQWAKRAKALRPSLDPAILEDTGLNPPEGDGPGDAPAKGSPGGG